MAATTLMEGMTLRGESWDRLLVPISKSAAGGIPNHMPRIMQKSIGFDGRAFLTEAEWQTYRRRMAVRYIRCSRQGTCQVCGQQETPANPLQSAHVIGFCLGVTCLALTPDYLDSEANIVTAHRRSCNRDAELSLIGSMARLKSMGFLELPGFLPAEVLGAWVVVVAPGMIHHFSQSPS